MTDTEFAQFLATIGFIGFAFVAAWACWRAAHNGYQERGLAVIAFGNFVVMFAGISFIGQLGRPPFEWLDAHQVTVANGFWIWGLFLFTAIVVVRRHA